jgi:hypothetical protein
MNTEHYKNTAEAEQFLMMQLSRGPLDEVPTFEGNSIIIEVCTTENYTNMFDAAADGAVYRLHDENLYSVDQVERLLDTFESTLRMIGAVNRTEVLLSIRIEAAGGAWLVPINDVPIDYVMNVIEAHHRFIDALLKKELTLN